MTTERDLIVREMQLVDVDMRIDYFHNASDDYLRTLGVDRALAAHRGNQPQALGQLGLVPDGGWRLRSAAIRRASPGREKKDRSLGSAHLGGRLQPFCVGASVGH